MLIEKWVVLELAVSLPRSDVRYLSNTLHTTLGCPPQFTSGWHTFIVTYCNICMYPPGWHKSQKPPNKAPQHGSRSNPAAGWPVVTNLGPLFRLFVELLEFVQAQVGLSSSWQDCADSPAPTNCSKSSWRLAACRMPQVQGSVVHKLQNYCRAGLVY